MGQVVRANMPVCYSLACLCMVAIFIYSSIMRIMMGGIVCATEATHISSV